MRALLFLIFFLSGAAALIFERLWFHQAGLSLGNSVWASSLVLAGFMGGLALGNGLAARVGHRLRRPLRLYALLEVTVGATGIGLVLILPRLTPVLRPVLGPLLEAPLALNAARLSVAFLLLMLPATAMGATLPVVVGALCRRDPRFGRALGLLYGWNTLGAVAGVALSEAVLIGWLGVRGTGAFAALLDGLAAVVALQLSRRLETMKAEPPGRATDRRVVEDGSAFSEAGLLAAAFLCGGLFLALEVVWFRFLLLFVTGTGLAFALMLAVVLAGIGLGGLIGAAWLSRSRHADLHFSAVALIAGATAVLVYGGFDAVLRAFAGRALAEWTAALALAVPLALPGSLLSGVLFTLLGQSLHRSARGATQSAGLLTLANTLGAASGALAAGFLLLPGLGLERSFQVLSGGYGLAAVAAIPAWRRRRSPGGSGPALAVAVVAFLAAVLLFPSGRMTGRYLLYPAVPFRQAEQATPVAIREGLTETSMVLRVDSLGQPFYYRLLTNSFSMSATHFRSLRYMKLFVYWPVAIHPAPKTALLLCYGVGGTAKALTDTESLEQIDVVDISRDILDLGSIPYPDPAERPLGDPRVRVHVEDGRHFLEMTGRRFDLITGEPPPPEMAGVVDLYTEEYFRLIHDHLEERGIVTYWLPVGGLLEVETKAIIRAFCEAFDDCSLWSGSVFNWVLIGTRNAEGPVPREHFARQWDDPVVGPEVRALGFETPEELGALFIADADDLREMSRGVPPLDDDHPKRLGNRRPDAKVVSPLYKAWLDVDRTRERFRNSRLIRRLWPEALRESTLAAFEWQREINSLSFGNEPDVGETLPKLHRLLTTSELRTLPLLLLGSSVQKQRTVDLALSQGQSGPALEYLLGLRALADRDFPEAVNRLARAQQGGDSRSTTTFYRLYALGMAGRWSEGLRLGAASGLATSAARDEARAWQFLARTFAPDSRIGSVAPGIPAGPVR